MKTPVLWLTTELADLKKAYAENPNISPAELEKRFPRHTFKAIVDVQLRLGIVRNNGAKRHKPGWASIVQTVGKGLMSRQEIADSLGCTRSNIGQILGSMRGHWHIGGWQPSGHYSVMTPLVKIGPGKDVPYPRKRAATAAEKNPFLIAAGSVKPIETVSGRVIKQDMPHDEEVAA